MPGTAAQYGTRLLKGYGSLEHETWGVNPQDVYTEIGRSSLGDMLFDPNNPGDVKSITNLLGKFPDIGSDTVSAVTCGASRVWMDRIRYIDISSENPYAGRGDARISTTATGDSLRVAFPGKVDWRGEVHLTFQHRTTATGGTLSEKLLIEDSHHFPGKMPTVKSVVVLGQTACERQQRPATSEDEVFALLGIVASLRPPLPTVSM